LSASPSLGTLFRLTLASGVAAAVSLQLRRGAPLDGRDAQGRTPLMLAAMRGHIDVCRVLLHAGADTTLRDLKGNDAADFARANGHSLILGLFASQLSPILPASAQLPAAILDDDEAALVSASPPLREHNAKQPQPPTPSGLKPHPETAIATFDTDGRAEVRDVIVLLSGADASGSPGLEEGFGPAQMIFEPNDDGAWSSASDAPARTDIEGPRAELAHWLGVNEQPFQAALQASPPLSERSTSYKQFEASRGRAISRDAALPPAQGDDSSADANDAARAVDAPGIERVLEAEGDTGWEPEPEPDLTPFGTEIAVAAAERENALSRHASNLPDADWADTSIDLPDTAPDWSNAFKVGSDGFRAVVGLVSSGLREGWVLVEELDALRESLVDGEKGHRLLLALDVLLGDLGLLVEDEHAIDWARMGAAESDYLQTSGTAHEVAAGAERLAEIWGASPDAERMLLEAAASAPVLSKEAETRIFRELAASLIFMQAAVAASPLSASFLENWADQLEARSALPREISEAAWGVAAAFEPNQDIHVLTGETPVTDFSDVAGSQAADALAAHLRKAAVALLQLGDATELMASARLIPRRILELTEACLGRQGACRREGLRASILRSNGARQELAVLRRPASGARQTAERAGLDEVFQRYIDARQAIVEANLKRVVWLARRYARAAVPFLDLVQEGQIGLLRAIDRFDPDRGFRFGTYATWWIRQSMRRYVQDQGRTIRVPVHMLERIAKATRVSEALRAKNGVEPTPQELAVALETDVMHVQRALNGDLEGIPFNDMGSQLSEEGQVPTPLVDEATPLTALLHNELRLVLAVSLRGLDARQARVIDLRFGLTDGNPLTLEEVGQVYRVTRERIRQIEAKSLKRLPRLLPDRQFQNLVP